MRAFLVILPEVFNTLFSVDRMNLDLRGRGAMVCGSSQGIGLAAAQELAELGANVTLFARNKVSLALSCKTLAADRGQVHGFLVADFSDPTQVVEVANAWLDAGNIAHILVNNTGGPPAGPALDANIEEFLTAFRNHLVINQLLTLRMVPGMKNAGYGRIINVISTSVKQPIQGLGVSNTVRGAVANWAKTIATELAPHGITVNNVLPGATRTARLDSIISNAAEKQKQDTAEVERKMIATIPAGRFGEADEIGQAIAFLASPAASYITGINLPVDGGRTQCL